ncbi:MAG TPA: hypothetical protein VNA65_10240, partial [Candidatus Dormibacteraeota bacterium]|nr:hypothetical protein [Candidatus Dormibacteraeota bacterium]
ASPTSSPIATAATSPSSAPGPASLVHCTTAVPAGDNLVIGTVVGDPTVVVRDIQDPANAKNLCTIDSSAVSPQFVSPTAVAYETSDNQIIQADLTSNTTAILATFSPGFGSGQYAISPDGHSITYLEGNAWHVAGPSGNRVLSTLPAVPGRGVNPLEDDSFIGFSPDGQYAALFQTFHVGGSGETAPDQIRRVSDGKLVYSTSGMTMAVWASVPSRLFFRDTSGNVHRWDPNAGLSSMTSLHWIRPRSSPDGRWVSYTIRNPSSGIGSVGFYSVQSNSVQATTQAGRAGATFLSNDLVWYGGEKTCTVNCGIQQVTPTGVTYIYSITSASEVTSRLSAVYDAWPHQSAPGL